MVIYCSISWSDFVVDDLQRYYNGFAYPVILVIVIIYNLYKIFRLMWKDTQHKSRVEKAKIAREKFAKEMA